MIIMIPAKDLRPGQLLDLEGDSVADPTNDNALLANLYLEVESVEQETPECVMVHFDYATFGFPKDHLVAVQAA